MIDKPAKPVFDTPAKPVIDTPAKPTDDIVVQKVEQHVLSSQATVVTDPAAVTIYGEAEGYMIGNGGNFFMTQIAQDARDTCTVVPIDLSHSPASMSRDGEGTYVVLALRYQMFPFFIDPSHYSYDQSR